MSDARGCGANFYFDGVGRLLAEDYFPCGTPESPHAQYSAPAVDTLPSGDKLPASIGTGVEVLYSYDGYVPPAQAGLTFDNACDPSTAPGQLSLGRLVRVSDLGAESYTVYDGRGRNTCATTRLTKPYSPSDAAPVPAFADRYAPRWYAQEFTYDAADRVVIESTGARVLTAANGTSSVVTEYGSRGTVKKVTSPYGDLVAAIDRTADGLVTRVEYADLPHTATTYTFDDRRRVHTAITARAPPAQWPADFETDSDGTYPLLLQDEVFTYDVVGNPTEITDNRIPEEWPAGSKPVSRRFQYDDLYRVIKADYKYEAGDDVWKSPFDAELNALDGAGDPRRTEPSPHVAFAKRILWQSYQYDWLGNTRTSNDDAKGFYDRSLGTITNGATKAYQLTGADNTTLGNSSDGVNRTGSLSTTYDNSGNLTKLEVTRNGKCAGATSGTCSQSFLYSWDEVGRLVRARRWDQGSVPAGLGNPAVDLQCHYAAGDSRVLKTARDAAGQEVHTAYIFPSLELRRAEFDGDAPGDYTLDSSTEVAYLFANGVRLARLVHQPLDSAGDGHLLRVFFELGDHLGSTSVALDKDTGELVERSTYQAYGGAESSYRPSKWGDFREDYRFTGKEEDVEVGLTYFGKRFYNALLQRWVSADPFEVHEVGSGEPNVYAYVSGRALQNTDPLGLADDGTQSFVGEGADATDATAQSFSTSADNAAPTNQSTFTPIPERTESDAAPVAAKKQEKYVPQNPLEGAAAGALTELASTGQALTLGLSVPSEQGTEAGAVTAFPDATLKAVESLERLKTDKPLEGEASLATRLAYSVSKAVVTVATISMGRRFGSLLADAKASIQAGKGVAKNTELIRLNKSLASEQHLGELEGGAVKVMAGQGGRVPIRDEPRLLSEHGGQPGDWQKISTSSYKASDGSAFETHAYRNAATGQVVEPKSKVVKP